MIPSPFDGRQRCATVGADCFFPEPGGHEQARFARWICARCELQEACLEYAVTVPLPNGRWVTGIWAGTSEKERDAIREARARRAS